MKVQDIINITEDTTEDDAITALKNARIYDLPKIEDLKKEYEPKDHPVMDPAVRMDKPVMAESSDGSEYVDRMEPVNRLAIPMQKTIVRTAVSFAFGNPVKLICTPKDATEEAVLAAIRRVFHDNKTTSFNRTIGRDLFRATEIAECWYTLPTDRHSDYGFETAMKIRVRPFSPWQEGQELYPYFDEYGDLKAFSRAYSRNITKEKQQKYFETYTDEQFVQWIQNGTEWEEVQNLSVPYGKIPIIYGRQEAAEWVDVQTSICRLEFLLSNFADIIDYHAAPKIFVSGNVTGFSKKGESGAIIEGTDGADAKYLSWEFAPEAVKLEIETCFRIIFSCTQTPDISFDSVKGLQQISGEALKMLFMDAHLKVQDKREVLDAYFQRRINVVKAILGTLNPKWANVLRGMQIEPEIEPYTLGIEKETIANLTAANGGLPIISQKTAVALSGLVDNPEDEYDQIQKEEKAQQTQNIFNPVQP